MRRTGLIVTIERLRAASCPCAIAYVLSGLRLAATLSVIGAVVGELIGSSAGLGQAIRAASSEIAMERICAALLLLSALGYLVYFCVVGLQQTVFKRIMKSLVES